MRGGAYPERAVLSDPASEKVGKAEAPGDRPDQFPREKLFRQGALWLCADHVSLELSFFAVRGAHDRGHCGGKLLCPEALRLFPRYFRGYKGADAGGLSSGVCGGGGRRQGGEQRSAGGTV